MNSSDLICRPLTEIADVERTQKNRIYPEKTIYVQVSACKKNTEQIWNLTRAAGTLEDKYSVVTPKIDILPRYFVIALENVTPEWMARYVGSNINIAMDLFKHLQVYYHPKREDQYKVLAVLNMIQEEIDEETRTMAELREAKTWFLEKMIAQENL